MKIIKPCNIMRAPRASGLLRVTAGQCGVCRYPCRHQSAAGAPRRGRRGSSHIIMKNKHSITHICLTRFNMEMFPVFPLCVPVAPGSMSVCMGNPNISPQCQSPGIGGDSACPPEPPLRFSMVLQYLFGNYQLQRECHSGGGNCNSGIGTSR